MGSYDNTDISYKAAGAETYHLPILYTEDEAQQLRRVGHKKENCCCRSPFTTILIDAFVLCATVVYLFVKQRQTPAFSVWISCWGGLVGDVSYGVALVLTVLILKPLDWLLDKIMHRPEEPKMPGVTPKGNGRLVFPASRYNGTCAGMLTWDAWEAALAVETDEDIARGGRDCGSEAIRSHRSIRLRNRSRGWIIRRSR